MSYDLYFKSRTGAMTDAAVLDYFRGRANYAVEHGQAVYENEDTGVHFLFELQDAESDFELADYPVVLNLNFWRPSYFVREAEPEVTAFVEHFDCIVLDPQERMADGAYRSDELVAGWNHGNEFAYSVALKELEKHQRPPTLPTSELTRIWRWNCGAKTLQEQQTRDTYVAHIFIIRVADELATMAVWPDAISSVLPRVDYLMVGRKRFAPRRFFKQVEDEVLLPWSAALSVLERHGAPHPAGGISLNYVEQPSAVVAFVRSLKPQPRKWSGVEFNAIRDRELVEKALAGL